MRVLLIVQEGPGKPEEEHVVERNPQAPKFIKSGAVGTA